MGLDQPSPEVSENKPTLSPAKRLAGLAYPLFGQRHEPNFQTNNFYNRNLRTDTPPHRLFGELLKSLGEQLDQDMQFYIDLAAWDYAMCKERGEEREVTEMVLSTIPRNSLIHQSFDALHEFLDDHFDHIYDEVCDQAARVGEYAVALAVLDTHR
jgi:hypothetical protein